MSTSHDITDILGLATEKGVSDLILTAGLPPQFKISGVYDSLGLEPLTGAETRKLVYSMMNEKQQKAFEETKDLDFSFALGSMCRYRVNAFQQRGNVGAVMRQIPTTIKSAEEMNLPETVVDLAKNPRGLVLVTGPTGSGKSTTLAAIIDWINVNKRAHIMTIEDPIEFVHRNKNSIINQREIGVDTLNFKAALKAVLRQAPDVILVGEMRDKETIEAAVAAAETGHLVMGTLHTNSAPEAVDRIIDVFPHEAHGQIRTQLAASLVGIMTQQLVPKVGGGRALAYELLIATPAIRALIREGKTFQILSSMQTGMNLGMITMDANLSKLYKAGAITFEVGVERAVDPKEFTRLAQDGPGPGKAGSGRN
ncbi:type IV pilus twitching motility protein PilT [Deinococcus soli (ex Cha et al. 2016)]|uniref:Twitching motility protein PilT n=2 Tax=Deinococcus soli (ex Cha et al. 2016) TaxID=1309411 RepID=A0ACC6KGF5_9DEIO|nr:type IV pilus twitching motility protein PilT [Deinococcus soli (ex Cha et al. 2016)]MDR6218145.1 twitching motility protein PilT [Deinococcus soli (ex Cha et al. 2016)]MDR6328885.1 twitching motility protein PilT [Deinococcus soli (ex Cha et al. 2016)]MDR6751627.1 twitching motility protein PilT [Deinococcus soli (ex Cha et al. 2016)]